MCALKYTIKEDSGLTLIRWVNNGKYFEGMVAMDQAQDST